MGKSIKEIIENAEGLVVLLVFACIVAVIKILVALRLATEKDNKMLILEFFISVSLGVIAGTVTHIFTDSDKWAISAACVFTWLGSKFDKYYYELLDTGVGAAKKRIGDVGDTENDGNNTNSVD